ncbi:hypothetical protein MRX96_005805 [Rhipicephalus microplus]
MAPVSPCALNSCSFAMSAFFDINFSLQPLTGPFIEHFLPGLLFRFALAGAGVPASRTRRFQFSPSTASLNPERWAVVDGRLERWTVGRRGGRQNHRRPPWGEPCAHRNVIMHVFLTDA